MTFLRRLGAYAGLWGLVGAVGVMVVFLLAATPRTVNRIQDQALSRAFGQAPYTVRDLLSSLSIPPPDPSGSRWPDAERLLGDLHRSLPQPLQAAVGSQWGAVRSGLVVLDGPEVSREPRGLPPKVTLLQHTGLGDGVRLIEGVPPRNESGPGVEVSEPEPVVEVMVSEPVARGLGLRAGEIYELTSRSGAALRIRVTGLFALLDETAPAWVPYRTLERTGIVVEGVAGDPVERLTATLVIDEAGMSILQRDPVSWGLVSELRLRLDEGRIDADDVGALREAVARARTSLGFPLRTGLDDLLAEYARQAASVRALLAVVVAGTAGMALGLLLLAARLAVDRRRSELALMRARGAALHDLLGRLTVESAAVVLPAVALGWLATRAGPGRAAEAVFGSGWAPAAAALLTLVALPVAATAAHRTVAASAPRRDLARSRSTPVGRTVEVTIGVLAVAGVVLVRRRGISQAGVDPYLAAVPVLTGAAAGLLVVRGFPAALRVLGRLVAHSRGGVAFLGLTRAGRAPAATALPLVVLVLAVAVGGFAGSVRVGLSDARDIAAARLVGGDLRLSATEFAPDAVDNVARVSGVTAVAAGHLAAPGSLRTAADDEPMDLDIAVLVLDLAAYQRVLEQVGRPLRLPAGLTSAQPDGVVPAVGSPNLLREPALKVQLSGGLRQLRVVASVDALPGLSRVDFVVVPREALGAGFERSSLLFVAGQDADPEAVRAAASALPTAKADDPVGPGGPVPAGDVTAGGTAGAAADEPAGVAMLVGTEQRRALQRSAFNDGITLALDVAAAAALLVGLLAIGFAFVVDSAARGRELSLLRAMGLAAGQARLLLLVELLPLFVTALVAGVGLGLVLPVLLAPALGLAAFAAGVPPAAGLDMVSVGLLAGLLLMLAAVAVLVTEAANRRLGLDEVLRV